ncbi:hypothetical protein BT67DRAFT_376898 [Trichocladium antarcticum]|uniref:Uncharacterized protein n=1 Tax=Trichocladium antarcticum TaxID=1450529 RepID=A0AAN6UNN0_9PEZI|nr:hypothetical protein BT67DRAFT_376898 [Trichocladium antarcticum]
MDDTSDPCWSWPHWKFGLKRNDLFTKLHDQYNTVPSPILDPEAFHHDVCELAQQATSNDELHHLLQDRKQQRLRELNETLESAAVEIIGNPDLIGTEQWHHAVQLFRTKSLDSLVRYFASYLPSDHAWGRSLDSDSPPDSDEGSSLDSATDFHPSLFDDECPLMTDEPFEFSTSLDLLPPSPRSMTMCSDSSVASQIDHDDIHHEYDLSPTPTRTLSYSESEPDCCDMSETHGRCDCERRLTPLHLCVPVSTITHGIEDEAIVATPGEPPSEEGTLPGPSGDCSESETPTPKPEAKSASFFEDASTLLPHHRRFRSLSPSRPQPIAECDLDEVLVAHRDPRNQQCSRFRKDRGCSPVSRRRRLVEPATRIQKPLSESARSRPRGRRGG